ncbi:MAG: response regulator [Magnetococcales bacterium]|nr:response regulator [Magnetococcales bacterium]
MLHAVLRFSLLSHSRVSTRAAVTAEADVVEKTSHASHTQHLKGRVIVTVAGFVAAVLVVMTIVAGALLSHVLTEELQHALAEQARSELQLLNQRLEYLAESSERLAGNPLVRAHMIAGDEQTRSLPELMTDFAHAKDLQNIALVAENGRALYGQLPELGRERVNRSITHALKTGLSETYLDGDSRQLRVVAPISQETVIQGAVITTFDLEAVASRILTGSERKGFRLLAQGKEIVSRSLESGRDYVMVKVGHSHVTGSNFQDLLDLGLEVGVPRDRHLAPIRQAILEFVAVGVVLALIALYLATRLSRSITDPILTLCRRVERSREDASVRCAPVGSGDELEDLADLFDVRTAELQRIQNDLEQRVVTRTADLEQANSRLQSANQEAGEANAEKSRLLEQLAEQTDSLIRSQRLLQQVLDAIPVRVFWKNRESVYLGCNRLFAEDLGLDSQQAIIGKTDHELPWREVAEHYQQTDKRVMISRLAKLGIEEAQTLADGRTIWLRTNKIPLTDTKNRVTGVLGTYEEITEHKATEEKILQAKEEAEQARVEAEQARVEAEEANRAKSEFLANMSHEIRTPLNAVINLSRLVQQTELDRRQSDYLAKVESAGRTLLGLINDILDFSKIEASHMTLEQADFNMEEVLENLATIIGVKAEGRKLEIHYDVAGDVPRRLHGDALRLEQVLINLCSNAVKFTEEGSVVLKVTLQEQEKRAVTLAFSVTDTGIGMSEEQMKHLFQSFHQGDGSISRKYGGTGLGLAISRKLVQLMGGDIGVESRLGQGSTFHFRARFFYDPDEKRQSVRVPGGMDLNVLVVDDSEQTRRLMTVTLSSMQIPNAAVASGEEAVEELKRCALSQGKPYDVVLMDWHMEGDDGISSIKKIRALSGLPKMPRSIMLTAYDVERVRTLAEKMQLDGFLIKPVGPGVLLQSLMQALPFPDRRKQVRKAGPMAPLSRRSLRLEGMHVLLVEDNEVNREIVVALLEQEGVVVSEAENGVEAVEAVEQGGRFDAVLMDIMMPLMDGYEATERVRQLPEGEGLPIIAMTAHALADEREKCLAVGMNDHVAKPIEPELLFRALLDVLPPDRRVAIAREAESQEREESEALPDLEGWQGEAAIARVGGQVAVWHNLLRRFKRGHGDDIQRLTAALSAGDLEKAAGLAHGLKGVAGNLGAMALSRVAARVESTLREEEVPDPTLLHDLKASLSTTLQDVEQLVAGSDDSDSGEEEKRALHEMTDVDLNTIANQLQRIHTLLESDIVEANAEISRLRGVLCDTAYLPLVTQVEEQVENFDIDQAGVGLAELAKALGVAWEVKA